jgi:XRE family aerobic/anaerobic benzoate catabolism transcriptional regulator
VPPKRAAPPPEAILGHLGARVRGRRSALGWTLGELAARSGVSQRFLSDVEGGRANISVVNLAAIARALATTASDLLAGAPASDRRGCVALLGLHGAGKSTIGPRLAAELGLPYVELDELVETDAGVPLRELVAVHGQRWWRRLEFQVLRRFLDAHERAVLATGSEIVTADEAFAMLLERCTTVWLRARPSDHVERTLGAAARAEALRAGSADELRALIAGREPLYSRADLVIETSALGVGGSVAALVQQLRARGVAPRAG